MEETTAKLMNYKELAKYLNASERWTRGAVNGGSLYEAGLIPVRLRKKNTEHGPVRFRKADVERALDRIQKKTLMSA
jgi:hypothetical protein